jgi:gamma-glutamylcysteine synthetase
MTWAALLLRLRAVPARVWVILGLALAALAVAAWIYAAGGNAVREDVAIEAAKVEVKAGKGREVAATERVLDETGVDQRQRERDDAAEQSPDSVPDLRDLRRRCRQLRDHGRGDVPACRGLEG